MDFKNLEIHYIGLCDAHGAEICECSFTDSNIHSCFMDFTKIRDSRWANASFTSMYMEKCLFEEVNLNGSSFHNLGMNESSVKDAAMNNASFTNTSMNDCRFYNSGFKDSKFVETDFSGAEIDESCDISGLTINGISAEELLKAYKEKDK